MKSSELNNITTNLRSTYPNLYSRLKKQCRGMKISREIEKRLTGKGFDNYEQLKQACPREVNISYFILEMIRSNVKKKFKIGDKVEIVGNIPFPLKDKPRPLLGTIVDVDGSYIDVKPKYQRWIAEFYPNELKHI